MLSNPLLTLAAAGGELDPKSHVVPHDLFGGWFTNHHLMSLVALAVGVLLLQLAARGIQTRTGEGSAGYVTRGRGAQLLETICIFLRDEVTRPLLGSLTDKYIYYVWSVFFFILLGNVLGMIPIGPLLYAITGNYDLAHFSGTMTGNLSFTAGLAIIAFFLIHGIALKENGLDYIKHGFPVPMKPQSDGGVARMLEAVLLVPVLFAVNLLVFALEMLLGPIIKAFALAIRLFANMVAGHLVLGSLLVLAVTSYQANSYLGAGTTAVGAAVFSFLELFVSFLQAYIFTFLTVIFISLGAAHHDEHDEHEAGLDEGYQPGEAMEEQLSGTQH